MERLDGEVIIVDFDSGHYYSFRGTAADILWLIDNGIATNAWPTILATSYSDLDWSAAQEGITTFLGRLVDLALIIPVDSGSTAAIDLPDDTERIGWADPEMLINDELADLLVIDPIHDVSDDGWPATPSD
jgi:hypothetical protein